MSQEESQPEVPTTDDWTTGAAFAAFLELIAPGNHAGPDDGGAAPTIIGHYRIQYCVGRGGFGTVYSAYDTHLERDVAIKVIDPHIVEHDKRWLFHEARAAARLKHPGIVTVFGVIANDSVGAIVEEFVEGPNLRELVEYRQFGTREAVDLVRKIAEVLEYAHREGIIHRDVKPANIMMECFAPIAMGEGAVGDASADRSAANVQLRPRLVDFGLAIQRAAPNAPVFDGPVGTRLYRSPEQESGGDAQATPRSDVFSLGVVFAELLVGRIPDATLESMRRGAAREAIEHLLSAVARSAPRDLHAICRKALQWSPDERFQSAGSFAAELARWSEQRPLELARNVHWPERALLWSRRNRALAASMVVILVAVVTALVGITSQYLRAEANLSDALNQEEKAERGFGLAHSAIRELAVDVSEDELLNEPGLSETRRRLMQRAADYYREFLKERGDDATVQRDLILARVGLAQILSDMNMMREMRSVVEFQLAEWPTYATRFAADWQVRCDICRAKALLAQSFEREGKGDDALKLLAQSREDLSLIAREFRDNLQVKDYLSRALEQEATMLLHARQHETAAATFQRARDLCEELLQLDPANADHRRVRLSHVLVNRATCDDVANTLENRVDTYDRVIEQLQLLDEATARTWLVRKTRATAYANRAEYRRQLGRFEPALIDAQEAVELGRECVRQHPDIALMKDDLAHSIGTLGLVQNNLEQFDQAMDTLREAIRLQESLVAQDATDMRRRKRLTRLRTNLGNILANQSRYQEADRLLSEELTSQRELARTSQRPGELHYQVALTLITRAAMYLKSGRVEDARNDLNEARQIVADLPQNPLVRQLSVPLSAWMAVERVAAAKPAEASELIRDAHRRMGDVMSADIVDEVIGCTADVVKGLLKLKYATSAEIAEMEELKEAIRHPALRELLEKN